MHSKRNQLNSAMFIWTSEWVSYNCFYTSRDYDAKSPKNYVQLHSPNEILENTLSLVEMSLKNFPSLPPPFGATLKSTPS